MARLCPGREYDVTVLGGVCAKAFVDCGHEVLVLDRGPEGVGLLRAVEVWEEEFLT